MKNKENVLIIGGGPAGLAASIYNARAGLNPLVIAGSPPGGQLTLTSEVENYPGFDSILGPDLIQKMRKHAEKFGVRFIDKNVVKVDFSNESHGTHKIYVTGTNKTNETHESYAVIIATGAKALWLDLPSEQRLRGKGVSACATCDGYFFKNKTVAVVGGGDTAMEEALTLTKFAKKIYIIHRRHEFRASKIMQERVLKNSKIEVIWDTVVEEVLGDMKVSGIKLKSQNPNLKSASQILNLDGVFIAIGHKPDTDLFKDQIEIDKKGYILTSNRISLENLDIKNSLKIENLKLKIPKFNVNYASQTSVKGVFAAGDCVDHVYRQAATAVGMGVAAALEVEKYMQK